MKSRKFSRKSLSAGFTLVELMIVVAIVGVLAVLAVFGVRKYISTAKTAEARNALGAIGKNAVAALEIEHITPGVLAPGGETGITRHLCATASQPVPAAATSIQGKKYQSNSASGADWNKDTTDAARGTGFACLKYEMNSPQFFMYNYTSDGTAAIVGTTMSATAVGDLDGNGTTSLFQLDGTVSNGVLRLAPSITETNPEE